MIKNKNELLNVLLCLYTSCWVISNILTSRIISLGDFAVVTAGMLLFPVVFIVNDLLTEIYGYKMAKKAIFIGLGINVMAVVFYNLAIILPYPAFATDGAVAFEKVLSTSFRVLIASYSAYLSGGLVNAYVMHRMKKWKDNQLMLRCIGSTVFGETVDSTIFCMIAFLGAMPIKSLLVMIILQATCKTLFEVFIYPVTKQVINKARKLPNI